MPNKICINCGAPATEQHHVIPLALGGFDIESNKVWLCSNCHALIHSCNIETRGTNWKKLQQAGIEKAKKEGKYTGRKRIEINQDLFQQECKKWRNGEQTARETMKNIGLKPNTFYRRVKEYGL